MTLKEFLEKNNPIAFETIPGQLIINVITGNNIVNGLNVDTSSIESGIVSTRETEFTVENNILTVAGLTLNTVTTTLLGFKDGV